MCFADRYRSDHNSAIPIVFCSFGSIVGSLPSSARLQFSGQIAQSTVARYMYRGWPPSRGWRTFLINHVDGIAAIDLFVLPTITLQLLYCLVILRHGRRLWVTFGLTTCWTAAWRSRPTIEALPR